jgi:hypothetical protein
MKLKKNLSLAILAATALLLPLASPAHDDDDDEREHRHRYKKERRTQVYYYYYYRPQEPVAAYRAPPPVANPQPGFPRESSAERQSSKGRQREILEAELATELQLLARARQDGKGDVDTHANNVEAIKRELKNLAR